MAFPKIKGISSGALWKRVGAVSLWRADIDKDSGEITAHELEFWGPDNLDFTFNFSICSDRTAGYAGKGEVSVLGLNMESIIRYSSSLSVEENLERRYFITVYAGYDDWRPIREKPLFTMKYIGAYPTSPPEMWLRFVGMAGNSAFTELAAVRNATTKTLVLNNKMTEMVKIRDAIVDLGEKYCSNWVMKGLEFIASGSFQQGAGSKFISNYVCWDVASEDEANLPMIRLPEMGENNTLKDVLAEINRWGVVRATLETYGKNRLGNKFMFIYVTIPDERRIKKREKEPIKEVFLVNEETGMIGPPHFGQGAGYNTLTVKTLLRDDIGFGSVIKPDSIYQKKNPSKYYRVIETVYEGHFRGTPWYSTFKCVGINDE